MKILIFVLVIVFLGLQYRLWVGEGSYANVVRLQNEINAQQAENARLVERNRLLAAEVEALKNGKDAVEAQARYELGLVKEGETLFLFVDDE